MKASSITLFYFANANNTSYVAPCSSSPRAFGPEVEFGVLTMTTQTQTWNAHHRLHAERRIGLCDIYCIHFGAFSLAPAHACILRMTRSHACNFVLIHAHANPSPMPHGLSCFILLSHTCTCDLCYRRLSLEKLGCTDGMHIRLGCV